MQACCASIFTSKMQVLCDISFFTIDNRKFSVWREAEIRLRQTYMSKVILHVFPARLFICSHHKAHALRYRQAQFFDDFQAVVTCHSWSLVITRTTSIETAILNRRCIRVCIPTTSSRYHIHMGKDTQFFFSLTKCKVTSIIVHILSRVTITFSNLQELMQGLYRTRSKRMLLICLRIIPL